MTKYLPSVLKTQIKRVGYTLLTFCICQCATKNSNLNSGNQGGLNLNEPPKNKDKNGNNEPPQSSSNNTMPSWITNMLGMAPQFNGINILPLKLGGFQNSIHNNGNSENISKDIEKAPLLFGVVVDVINEYYPNNPDVLNQNARRVLNDLAKKIDLLVEEFKMAFNSDKNNLDKYFKTLVDKFKNSCISEAEQKENDKVIIRCAYIHGINKIITAFCNALGETNLDEKNQLDLSKTAIQLFLFNNYVIDFMDKEVKEINKSKVNDNNEEKKT